MACSCLWNLTMLAVCVLMLATSKAIEVPAEKDAESLPGEVAVAAVEAPAGEVASPEKREEKRSGYHCNVEGHIYQHGEVFSYPGYSRCIKYRCNNGGYSVVQSACEMKSQCIPVGSEYRDNCRSMRCVKEDRGNMNYYRMEPTNNDMCNVEGRCVAKNTPFLHNDCHEYMCVPIANGGYTFRIVSSQCKDDRGGCVRVGQRFSKVVNGRWYDNCVCTPGGGYNCRG